MAGNAAGKGELLEQALHASFAGANIWIYLAVGSFEIGVGNYGWPAMTRTSDIHHVQVMFFYDPVQMDINKVQPRRRPPVAKKPGFDVFLGQRRFEQRVIVEIDLTDREVVGSPPVGVDQ